MIIYCNGGSHVMAELKFLDVVLNWMDAYIRALFFPCHVYAKSSRDFS